jgi:hypothetical protein
MRRAGRAVLAAGLVGLGVVGWVTSAPGQGGAASSVPPASEEAEALALGERAAAFWAARVAGDVDAQWQFLEPRWKGRMTAAEYGSDLTGGRWLAYRVEGATVKGLFATVKMRVMVTQVTQQVATGQTRPKPQVAVFDDAWIRIGGVWYRRLDPGAPGSSPQGQP